MDVTLLGTGAPLHPTRATTGMIVTAPGCGPLLIDTCGGLELSRRLADTNFERSELRAVIVTHRHLDHSGGIQDLFLARMPLDIYALPDTHEGISQITAGCFPEWDIHPDVVRHDVAPGTERDIVGFRVTFFAAEHRVPTAAVRVSHGGRTFAFSADTVACDAIVACAREGDVFLCDAFCAERSGEDIVELARKTMHPTAREAARMASQAGAGALVCTHISRYGDAAHMIDEAQTHFQGPVRVAEDGLRLRI